MPLTKGFPLINENKFDEIGNAVDKFPVIAAATAKNGRLLLAVSAAIQTVANAKTFNEETFAKIVSSNKQLATAAKDKSFKNQFFQLLQLFAPDKVGGIKLPPDEPAEADVEPDTSGSGDEEIPIKPIPETDSQLIALLGEIPIAIPGEIITDEYHNSLRNAVKAIAQRLGGVRGKEVITFAPVFLPVNPDIDFDKVRLGGFSAWEVAFNQAICPMQNTGRVIGAFTIHLPENASILEMNVRGKRFGNDENPSAFTIKLFCQEIEQKNDVAEELIVVDLKDESENRFKKSGNLSKPNLIKVENSKYNYFIEADWVDAGISDRFEINLIQILVED